jgi:hypothetical protein
MRHGRESSRAAELVIALVVAALSVGVFLVLTRGHGDVASRTDLDPLLMGARVLLRGGDPYAAVGPGRAFPWIWPLYHPVTALVAVAPLVALPLGLARAAFVGGGAFAFAWALARAGGTRWRWLVLASASFVTAVRLAQWSTWLAAALWLPALSILLPVKPNIGAVVLAAHPTRRRALVAAAAAILLALIGTMLDPGWVGAWIAAVRSAPHFSAPIARPWGAPLLLAALRWRRAEGRLLLALACVPQTPGLYDLVLLFAVPVHAVEYALLALLSHAADQYALHAYASLAEYLAGSARVTVLALFLPALAMLLARPNEGEIPAWLERRVAPLPRWLRGSPRPDATTGREPDAMPAMR